VRPARFESFKDLSLSKFSTSFAHLRVDGLSKTFSDRRVFTNVSFAVPRNDRVGIIGENGAGKSTLLRVIAGDLTPEAGRVEMFQQDGAGLDVGLLHQQPPFPQHSTVEHVLESSVTHLRKVADEVDTAAKALAAAPRYQATFDNYIAALDQAEQLGVWDINTRMHRTLAGLGLAELSRDAQVGELSGGQAARLALVSLLLRAPAVLLLDEPTNHLDDDGIDFLSSIISHWHGPVLIASHDRAFLDQTIVSLLDLDPAPRPHALGESPDHLTTLGVTRFTGTYSDYVQFKHDARQRWQHQYQEEQAQLQRLRASVDANQVVGHTDWKPRTEVRMAQKYYADRNARVVARRVNDARARLVALERRQVVKPPAELTFQGLDAASSRQSRFSPDEPLIHADQVAVGDRLQPTSLTITARDRLLITGANGVGKSTLLDVLAGRLEPHGGQVIQRRNVTIGLLSQESRFPNAAGKTPQAVYEESVGTTVAQTMPLSTYGLLHPHDQNRPVETLSIGQQRRLALAIILADPPEVLLLDEPTNHLSLMLATELEDSIENYPGAIVVVSHDRWLRNRWTNRVIHLTV